MQNLADSIAEMGSGSGKGFVIGRSTSNFLISGAFNYLIGMLSDISFMMSMTMISLSVPGLT